MCTGSKEPKTNGELSFVCPCVRMTRFCSGSSQSHSWPVSPTHPLNESIDEDDELAHLSACGRHLVGLLSDGQLVLVEDFERLFVGATALRPTLEAIANCVSFELHGGPALSMRGFYLAYEHDRVALAVVCPLTVPSLQSCHHPFIQTGGLYVVSLNAHARMPPAGPVENNSRSFPHVRVARVRGIDDWPSLRRLSCIQLTSLAVWFTWLLPWWKDDGRDVDTSRWRKRLMWVDVGVREEEMAKGPFGVTREYAW